MNFETIQYVFTVINCVFKIMHGIQNQLIFKVIHLCGKIKVWYSNIDIYM